MSIFAFLTSCVCFLALPLFFFIVLCGKLIKLCIPHSIQSGLKAHVTISDLGVMMTNTKEEVDKFTGKNNFSHW